VRRAGPLALTLAALCLAGCANYHWGFQPRPGVRTVAIPIAENLSLRRQLEFPLSEAIVRETQRRTPVYIVRDRGEADATLLVTIQRVDEAVLVQSANTGDIGVTLESSVAVYLDVQLVGRDGATIIGGPKGPIQIVETAQVPDRLFVEQNTLPPDLFDRLAQRVVMVLESPIGVPYVDSAPRSRPR
jgi:hypothetical protein